MGEISRANRRFEMGLDLYEGLPRLDTIRSPEELARVQNAMRGRRANAGIRKDGRPEGELISVMVLNKRTGEVQYLSPQEYEVRKYNQRRLDTMRNCQMYGACLLK